MDWQRMASQAIERVHASLPEDATVADRKRALRAAASEFHGGTSWGKKVWAKHSKRYLARFGPVVPQKPFQFGDDIIFPYAKGGAV